MLHTKNMPKASDTQKLFLTCLPTPKKARYPKARRAYRRQAPAAKRQTKTGSYRVSYPNDLRTLRAKTIRAAS